MTLDLVPVNLLGYLAGPISVTPKLKTEVRPLFAGLNLPEGEVCCNNNFVQPLAVDYLRSSLTCSILLELGLSDHLELLTGIWSTSHTTYGYTCLI
jgi:hypothetical protein